ncbi:hypothetical protein F0562_012538 [Nyssa sinensis]|uniref:F-box protein n=1 Tax=Nyssa sinensis TaxID=561372 RepID=A0A5J4ZU07_9ASTE|nr:hypothetical protein F0562_012538 [Nyssa sinensis]
MCLRTHNRYAPPWEVMVLVANHLEPKALAMAACVCKSWFTSMSSDHLWKPFCSTRFPSLSRLQATDPAVSYRRLYSLGYSSAKRRLREPLKPRLSLENLTFAIDVHGGDSCIVTIVKPGGELDIDPNAVFRFDIDVHCENLVVFDVLDNLKLTWNVVLNGFKGVFTVMESKGKGSFVPETKGWFSEELPSPGCCSSMGTSGLVADVSIGLRGSSSGKKMVEKITNLLVSIYT